MHTILRGRATGAPHRVDSAISGKDSGDRWSSKDLKESSPLEAKNAASQSRNSADRSRRLSLTNTPGFSLPRSPNRISFICLRKMLISVAVRLQADQPACTPVIGVRIAAPDRVSWSPHSRSRILETASVNSQQEHPEDTAPLYQEAHCLTSSTRRFLARPSSASFDATGAVGPSPAARSLLAATPYLVVRDASTASARFLDRSMFMSRVP